jgi:ADP-ribose pyrophosphatase YjhB (NUDIX family)
VACRIDFYDDPSAPAANSLGPSVNVVVANRAGDVLLIRRSDNDNWAVPGGAVDLGESLVQAAVRETREETGIDCQVTWLVGIYTAPPRHVILYTSNPRAWQEFSIVLTARATGGDPERSEESSEVRWVPRVDLGGYPMKGRCGCGSGITSRDVLRRISVYRALGVLPDLLAAATAVHIEGRSRSFWPPSPWRALTITSAWVLTPRLGQHPRDVVTEPLRVAELTTVSPARASTSRPPTGSPRRPQAVRAAVVFS